MALLFTILCGGAMLVLGYFGYYFARGHFILGTEAVLDSEIRYVASLADPLKIPRNDERLYVPFPEDGSNPAEVSEVRVLSEGIVLFDNRADQKTYAAKIHTLESGQKILVAVDITRTVNDYRLMFKLSVLSIGLMIAVIGVSYLISVFVVRGTNQIADTARNIMKTGDLTRRIEVKSRWDDLSNMADALNLLLERIEHLMKGVRQVSDNIAHDLRTPLTRLKNRLEDLKKQQPENASYCGLLDEVDNILLTFNAILRISRIEHEQQRSQFRDVNLSEILMDVVAFYEPVAEEKNIVLAFEGEAISKYADRDLLFQTFLNLVDNAIKFTPEGGRVAVRLIKDQDQAVIEIEDTGPGIHEQEQPRVFDHFYRAEQSRHRPGTGLGLSLVAASIKLHQGLISMQNTGSGLKIITIL